MDSKEKDVIKVQYEDFDVCRIYVLRFCLAYLRNFTVNITLEQQQNFLKEQP